jgi:hypothetical protein
MKGPFDLELRLHPFEAGFLWAAALDALNRTREDDRGSQKILRAMVEKFEAAAAVAAAKEQAP